MKRYGFTMLELLVVVAAISLLGMIIIPVLNAAKQRGRNVRCVWNLHQISLAFTVYQQTHQVVPYGFCDLLLMTTPPPSPEYYSGTASYDRQGWWWFDFLRAEFESDLRPGSIFWCPSRKMPDGNVEKNILCGNYGVNRSVCKDAQGVPGSLFSGKPFRTDSARSPGSTFLVSDSGYSLVSWKAAVDTDGIPFENPARINYFYLPGLAHNRSRGELMDNPDAIKGRHPHQTLNLTFIDGHYESRPAESLAIEKNALGSHSLSSLWIP